MQFHRPKVESFTLTEMEGLDPISVYITNYAPGKGKITIDCFGNAWTAAWGAMGGLTVQEFLIESDNDYLIRKMIGDVYQIDFDKINADGQRLDRPLCVTSEVEIAEEHEVLEALYGPDWRMDLPSCKTPQYAYLNNILNHIKLALGNWDLT